MAGAITVDHVRLLVGAKQLSSEAFADSEARLVHLAGTLRVAQFEKALTYWKHLHEPDLVEDDALAAFKRREAHASATLDNTVVVDALLDPTGGAIFLRELERLEQELFEADWAEARARVGDHVCTDDLLRTPKQRRADAMRIMAERSAAKPADATEARVLLQVLVGEETLARICELSNGLAITPGQVLPVLDRADVERIEFDGPSKVIDVGVRRRLRVGRAHHPDQRPMPLRLPQPPQGPTTPAGRLTREPAMPRSSNPSRIDETMFNLRASPRR